MKRCSRCKETKPKSEFYRNRRCKDGLSPRCKACQRTEHQEYYASPVVKEAYKRRGQTEEYREVHRRNAASEKGRASHKRALTNRRVSLRSAECTLTAEEWFEIKAEHNCCPYCEEPFVDGLHMDHVIPLSRGGTHVAGNVLPVCQSCNLSKGNKTLEEWNGQVTACTL